MPYDETKPDALEMSVDSRIFAAVRHAQAKEETRYYLNGVFVTPMDSGGVLMVATNGHILLKARDKNGFANRSAILTTAWTAVQLRKKGSLFASDCSEIDGTFPDHDRITPKMPDGDWRSENPPVQSGAKWNMNYLDLFRKAAKCVDPGADGIEIHQMVTDDPAIVTFEGCPDMFGIMMPMRGATRTANALPDWARS